MKGNIRNKKNIPYPLPSLPTSRRFRVEGVKKFQDAFNRVNESMTGNTQFWPRYND